MWDTIDKQTVNDALETLLMSERVLIVAHQKPDGDTVGSSLALWHWLKDQGKYVHVFCRDEVPDQLLFLPNADQVSTDPELFQQNWDSIIICDSGDLEYAGVYEFAAHISEQTKFINFDHHTSNQNFGHYNLVDASASSTAEVIFCFFREIKFEINQDIARCLMTGVFTDTGGFSNAATNQRALFMASEFSTKGASLPDIIRATVSNKNLDVMRLWGKVLSRLRQNNLGMAYTYIFKSDLQESGLSEEAISGLSNYLSHLKDSKAVIVLHEREDGKIKVSMRTFRDDVDLSRLATAVGGGGHQKASGFAIPGRLEKDGDTVRVVEP